MVHDTRHPSTGPGRMSRSCSSASSGDQPASTVTVYEPGGLECGECTQTRWDTDARGKGDVSDRGSATSWNCLEYRELGLRKRISCPTLALAER